MARAKYRTRIATAPKDIEAAQRLRYRAFIAGRDAMDRPNGLDADSFDGICRHVLVDDVASGRVVATFRLLRLGSGAEIGKSYSAQHYGLKGLSRFRQPMVEMGRFCVAPGESEPGILRVAWSALAAFVDREGIKLLFGCSSFDGTDGGNYRDAFAMLKARHLAPRHWLPRIKSPNVFRFAQRLRAEPDRRLALCSMPPLLRSYLSMGGWVSDHAVIDRDLNTLHVFTGLEVDSIPSGRARLLRAAAVSPYGREFCMADDALSSALNPSDTREARSGGCP